MVIHLPPDSRFKTTFDPDDRIKPPGQGARPTLTASQVRANIDAQFAK